MIKAVLFDLDGTILDTVYDIQARVNEMLAAFSYPLITLEQTRAYVGDGARNLIERSLPQGATNVDECFSYFIGRFEQSENELTRLFEGETEALAALKARGIKLAVITNKPHLATVRLIEKFFPADTFELVLGDSGAFPIKPDPTIARYAALTLRVSPAECLFVGDGDTDVKVALRAGMHGVACLWGYRSEEQLAAVGARQFIAKFDELVKIIEKIS